MKLNKPLVNFTTNLIKRTKYLLNLIDQLVDRTRRHHNSAFAAQIAFFLFLSIFPFIIVFITIAGNMLDISYVSTTISELTTIPTPVKVMILEFVMVANNQHLSILSLSFVTILWATSRTFYGLSHAFNMAHGLDLAPNILIERLKGLAYTGCLAIALSLAMLLPALSRPVVEFALSFIQLPPFWSTIILIVKWSFYILVLTVILSTSYYIIPKERFPFKSVWPGTFFTLCAWWVEANVFNLIVIRFSKFSLVYGTLATVAIMMLWLYTLSGTLIIGAEINAMIKERRPEQL